MDQELRYFQVTALNVTGLNGQVFRNKREVKDKSGKPVMAPTIVTSLDLGPQGAENYLKSGHIKEVDEKTAEKFFQKKSLPKMISSSSNSTPSKEEKEKELAGLKDKYVALGGKAEDIKAQWGAPKLKTEIEKLEDKLLTDAIAKFHELGGKEEDVQDDWTLETFNEKIKELENANPPE